MKEQGLPLPVAVPSVHAQGVYVIYHDGRPLVEAYDGPQIVGMTCTGAGRCWSG